MKLNNKLNEAYKTIGEVAKELDLIDKKKGNLQTHTIRYWETQFKQIKPSIRAGKRRYYSKKDFKIISHIKFLLKDKGLTINGARKLLNKSNINLYFINKFKILKQIYLMKKFNLEQKSSMLSIKSILENER